MCPSLPENNLPSVGVAWESKYLYVSFYLTDPPSSDAVEYLFHPFPLVSGFLVVIWLSFTIKCQSLCKLKKKYCKTYTRKTMCFMQTASSAPIQLNCNTFTES